MEPLNHYPKNELRVRALFKFHEEIRSAYADLAIMPILGGSLAVFGYTQDQNLEVKDIDLACPESAFPALRRALTAKGMEPDVKAWHVLQVRCEGLKIEFAALEHWMIDIPEDYDTLTIAGIEFKAFSLGSLIELYKRGLEATAPWGEEPDPGKRAAMVTKYRILSRVNNRGARF